MSVFKKNSLFGFLLVLFGSCLVSALDRRRPDISVNDIPDFFHGVPKSYANTFSRKYLVANRNTQLKSNGLRTTELGNHGVVSSNGALPGDSSLPFTLFTLSGQINYPHDSIFQNVSLLFVVYNNRSSSSLAMWTDDSSLRDFVTSSPSNALFIFFSASDEAALGEVLWMRTQLRYAEDYALRSGFAAAKGFVDRQCLFATTSVAHTGNWISSVFYQWQCDKHECGLDQVLLTDSISRFPWVISRLDAHYDWLPSAAQFKDSMLPTKYLASNGCGPLEKISGKVAVLITGDCSFAKKIYNAQTAGAVAAVIMSQPGETLHDMNCAGEEECALKINIPSSSILHDERIIRSANLTVRFQHSPGLRLCFGVNHEGKLRECGTYLYPSLRFFAWQSTWFDFERKTRDRVKRILTKSSSTAQSSFVVEAFNFTIMQGHRGVEARVAMPPVDVMRNLTSAYLDMSLSCPGDFDKDCPPWDHTVQLYVCCDEKSDLCGSELGRWISPFRRRIGRWVTDVSSLLPLLQSRDGFCQINMKTAWWAKPWKPSLRFLFTKNEATNVARPTAAFPLFRGGMFDAKYNDDYKPLYFKVPDKVAKVEIVSVITGHGQDDNNCAEFCVSSHAFFVNDKVFNETFSAAGTELGCAVTVPAGTTPNEYGTWLYGRGGWCNGRQVDPWVIDVTDAKKGNKLKIDYRGFFLGKNPNPHKSGAEITMYSYLIFFV